MKQIGRRIYYDFSTGNVIVDTGERQGSVRPTTVDQDILAYSVLSERNRDSFDVLEFPFGAYAQDFAVSNDYRVNPETKQIEFSYPDPNGEEPEEPVYQKSLSEELEDLKTENELLKASVLEMTTYTAEQDSRLATQEQAMLELTTLIAGGNV